MVDTDRKRLVAEHIATARQTAGLSKGALAARVGVRLWLIDRIEAGVATPPDELVEGIAEATGRSSAWLLGDDDGQPPPTRLVAAPTRWPAEGAEPPLAVDQPEMLRFAAELVALAAERDRLTVDRDRLAATLAQAHIAAAAREAAIDVRAAELASHKTELAAREAELAARESELAELTANQAEIGRALIRRQIRQELEDIAVEF